MFKKLLANLPFNPSLLDQLSFYSTRLKRETAIRRLGFAFMALALLLQVAATLYPAQKSLAASPNNVLNGLTDKTSLLRAYDNNIGNVKNIYAKFGITHDNLTAISGQKPNAVIRSTDRDFWSAGRLPMSTFGLSSNKWGERSVDSGGATVYERPLHAWDTHGSTSYAAFHGKNQYGQDFWILQNCGNPTFEGPYVPKAPTPKLTVHKTLLTNSVVHPGDTVKFRIEYGNSKADSLATNFSLSDTLNNNLEFVSLGDLSSKNGNTLYINRSGKLGYSATPYISTLSAKVRATAPDHSLICNQAIVNSDQVSGVSEKPCITVINPKKTAPPPKGPSGYCVATGTLAGGSSSDFTVRTSAYVGSGTQITGYTYDIDSNGSIDSQDKTNQSTYEKQFKGLGSGPHTILVYAQLANSAGAKAQTAACQAQVIVAEDARVNLSKSVTDITQKRDANGTTVQNGDTLEFKLATRNVTASSYKNYNGQDYFGSVLQYADIADMADLSKQGLSLDANNYLHWNLASLAGGATDTKTVKVTVKNIIPVTNTPSNISPDYNCKITNDYGNEVTMNINCPVVKKLDAAATQLPNTGPGTSIILGSFAVIFAGYFFSRSRIMAKELAAVRKEYISSGGF
jgi:fimbrial isopeptide formation D2 family protein